MIVISKTFFFICVLLGISQLVFSQENNYKSVLKPQAAKVLSIKKIKHIYLIQVEVDNEILAGYTFKSEKKKKNCNSIKKGNTYDIYMCYDFSDTEGKSESRIFLLDPYYVTTYDIEGVKINYKMRKSPLLFRFLNLDGLCFLD